MIAFIRRYIIELIIVFVCFFILSCSLQKSCNNMFAWVKTTMEEPEETDKHYFAIVVSYENKCIQDTVIFLKENINGGNGAFQIIYENDTLLAGVFYFRRMSELNEVKIPPLTKKEVEVYPYGYRSASERTHTHI